MFKYTGTLLFALFMFVNFNGPSEAFAISLQVTPAGILTGALNVSLGGVDHDVVFMEGSCLSLFSGCDTPDDFFFSNSSLAFQASQALLDQVLVDGPAGMFDTQPGQTIFCSLSVICNFLTPAQMILPGAVLQASVAINSTPPGVDVQTTMIINADFDTANDSILVYAVWGLSPVAPPPTPVPEPASVVLLGSGLAGLFLLHRRKRRQSGGKTVPLKSLVLQQSIIEPF